MVNVVSCGNEMERTFAHFLADAPDVAIFAKLPQRFGACIQYTDSAANLRNYEPDFDVRTEDGGFWAVGIKGSEDTDVAHKDRAARIWCENATLLTGAAWSHLKVLEKEFKAFQPTAFADLSVFVS